jgi:hypothetical protein
VRRVLVSIMMIASLSACATGAKPGAMAVQVSQSTLIDEQSGLYKSTEKPVVTGGKKTNPLWASNVSNEDFAAALEQTLSANVMLASANARFKLSAQLVELKQPFAGFNMTVTAKVKYTLTSAADGKTVWEKEITTPYTAKMGDAFVGVKRLQLANEGAIRENIKQFVDQLVADSKTNPELQPAAKPVAMLFDGTPRS